MYWYVLGNCLQDMHWYWADYPPSLLFSSVCILPTIPLLVGYIVNLLAKSWSEYNFPSPRLVEISSMLNSLLLTKVGEEMASCRMWYKVIFWVDYSWFEFRLILLLDRLPIMAKLPKLSFYLSLVQWRIDGFMPFTTALARI